MFFQMKGSTYAIRIVRVGTSTFAELMRVKENGELSHTNFVGEVRLYYKDNFVAKTGRKLALARLIDVLNKKMILSEEERATIWAAYFERYGR